MEDLPHPADKMPAELKDTAADRIAEITRDGWRELGFWYACDVGWKQWRFRADRKGLELFAGEVRRYLAMPGGDEEGEHVHLGPFCNLRLIRATEPSMDWRGISGRREDWEALAVELDGLAMSGAEGGRGAQAFASGFSNAGGFSATIEVEPDGFDPASADQPPA